MVTRAYKFRIYPSPTQIVLLTSFFGAARWVWNTCLAWRGHAYKAHRERVTGVDFSRELTWLKRFGPYGWLGDVPATILTQALRDLDRAFANFFARRAKYPRFKKRRTAQAIRFQLDQRVVVGLFRAGELLKLPGLGVIKVRWSRLPTGVPKMVTLRRDAAGRYFVSFMCEETVEALPALANGLGVDRGIKDVIVRSDGEKSGAPKYYRKHQRRLKLAQRVMSRRKKGSGRWRRAKARVAKIHTRIADSRNDFTHKATTKLVREAQVIALEDLNVRGMMRNRRLAKSIGDSALHEVQRQIAYKAAWYGREVLYCDRWAPSTKTCPECGVVQAEMPLKVREWVCPECGEHHDRDIAAARNVLMFSTGGRPGIKARGARTIPSAVAVKATA